MRLFLQEVGFERLDKLLFSNVNFDLCAGELLHIQGANGVGKSTLLKIIAGLLPASSGEIFYQEQALLFEKAESSVNPKILRVDQHISAYQACIHYIGHQYAIHPALTVAEYWTLELAQPLATLKQALEQLHFEHRVSCLCGNLSAGSKRKMALLRLLADPKRIWLLDEPWSGLDTASSVALNHLLEAHLREQGIVVLTSHQPVSMVYDHVKVFSL